MILFTTFMVSLVFAFGDETKTGQLAPLLGIMDKTFGNRFIVNFKKSINGQALNNFFDSIGIKSVKTEAACDTFAFVDANSDNLSKLRSSSLVNYVEYVQEMTTLRNSSCKIVSKNATWGVARISKAQPSKSRIYATQKNSGQDVRIYILDTGINVKHEAFKGRAIWGKNVVPGSMNKDVKGHGTCVGGLAAAVSPGSTIYAVKIMNDEGKGSSEVTIKGLCWVWEQANKTTEKVVVNLSIGGDFSQALNDIVNKMYESGVGVVVAAGNEHSNACKLSPSSAEHALTTGASNSKDQLVKFSNFGKCVKLVAPGTGLTCPDNKSRTRMKSGQKGTSFSSPIVAGLLANVISVYNLTSGANGYSKVLELAQKGVLTGLDGERSDTPNLLANNQCNV